MRLRVIALATFLFQVALGDLCMMQMASAQEMEMPPMHGSHHCDDCPQEKGGATEETPTKDMNCGDGHCLMHDRSDRGSAVQSTNPLSAASVPPSPNTLLPTLLSQTGPVLSTPPPDIPFVASAVVLRC